MPKKIVLNKKNIRLVAAALDAEELARPHRKADRIGFNMCSFGAPSKNVFSCTEIVDKTGRNCGTVACIAGWAYAMFNPDGTLRDKHVKPDDLWIANLEGDVPAGARKALGLRRGQAEALFTPDIDYQKVTPAIAAKVLRNFARTDKITWPASVK